MKAMMAIVWRESIYKNGFKCSCGKQLVTDGKIERDVLYNPHDKLLFCPECHNLVAMLKGEVEVKDDDETMLKGEWTEA